MVRLTLWFNYKNKYGTQKLQKSMFLLFFLEITILNIGAYFCLDFSFIVCEYAFGFCDCNMEIDFLLEIYLFDIFLKEALLS